MAFTLGIGCAAGNFAGKRANIENAAETFTTYLMATPAWLVPPPRRADPPLMRRRSRSFTDQ